MSFCTADVSFFRQSASKLGTLLVSQLSLNVENTPELYTSMDFGAVVYPDVLFLRSVGGCLGGFRVLWPLLVSVQQLCTGFEVRGRVFRWFLGLLAAFGLVPTTVYWF